MHEARVSEALLRRLNPSMLLHSDKSISISETAGDEKGRGTITFQLTSLCFRLRLPPEPVKWLANQQCADAVIFEFAGERTILHLIEMKTTMRPDAWTKTKQQLVGPYHNALALAGVLQLSPPFEFKAHVAYREDRLGPAATADGLMLKQPLGKLATETFNDWSEGRIGIDGMADIPLNKIRRDGDGNASASLG
nr:hypothetical protein [uncultured Rhodopila sp.]